MMRYFKAILNYIVYLNFIIATSDGILISGVANLFNISNYFEYGVFGFLSTFSVYNAQRLFKTKLETKIPWLLWVNKHQKLILKLSIVSGLISLIYLTQLLNNINPTLIIFFNIAVCISVFYVVRIGRKNIREFPYLKIHSIAFTWTIVIILFPLVNENILNYHMLTFFVPAHYLYFIAVSITFDIRDLKYDSKNQRTIPQVFGINNAKKIASTLLLITLTLIGVFSNTNLLTPFLVISIIVQILLITFIKKSSNNFYYAILIDSSIALLGISYLIM